MHFSPVAPAVSQAPAVAPHRARDEARLATRVLGRPVAPPAVT